MGLLHLFVLISSTVFMMLYFMTFLVLKYSLKKTIAICTACTIVNVLSEVVRMKYFLTDGWAILMFNAAQIVLVQGTALFIAKNKDSYTVFLGLSSSNFIWIGNATAMLVKLFTGMDIFANVVGIFVNIAVLLLMAVTTRDALVTVLSKGIRWWMCLIPCLCYMTFYFLLYFPVSYAQSPSNIFAGITLMMTMIVLYIVVIKYLHSRMEEKWLLWGNLALNAYAKGVEVQSEAVEAAQKEFRVMRHDIRHKDVLLLELLRDKKYEEAEQILSRDLDDIEHSKVKRYCENVIINSIMSGMARKAESMDVKLRILSAVPEYQEINDREFAILIANLIENALIAVRDLEEKDRVVEFKVKNIRGEKMILEVKNPCYQEVEFSKITGLPVSHKGEDHGFGMISVQEFVKKYHGDIDCYVENNEFVIRIFVDFMGGYNRKFGKRKKKESL